LSNFILGDQYFWRILFLLYFFAEELFNKGVMIDSCLPDRFLLLVFPALKKTLFALILILPFCILIQ